MGGDGAVGCDRTVNTSPCSAALNIPLSLES